MTVSTILVAQQPEPDGDGALSFLVELLVAGFIGAGLLFLLTVALAWWGWRRLRRSRRLERAGIAVRAVALPAGPRREIAQLRLRLRDGLGQTERVLAEFAGRGSADGLGQLLDRTRKTARELDSQLRLLRDEPADEFLRRELPGLRRRAEQISSNAQALRRTAMRLNDDAEGASRATLEQDLADEVTGLEVGLEEVRAAQRRAIDPAGEPPTGPSRDSGT